MLKWLVVVQEDVRLPYMRIHVIDILDSHPGLDGIEIRIGSAKPGSLQPFPQKPAMILQRSGKYTLVQNVDWEAWKTFPCDDV